MKEQAQGEAKRHGSMDETANGMNGWTAAIGSTELVWHRANREAELVEALASDVRWVECDARLDPLGVVRVSHEPLDGTEERMSLIDWLGMIHGAGRWAKIDLKEGGPVIETCLAAVTSVGQTDEELWFNAAVEIPNGEQGFSRLAHAKPGARLSCPLDTLASFLLVAPPAWEILDLLRVWGINWLCLGSRVPDVASLVPYLQERGWPINIWDVADDRDLDVALHLGPQAITADLGSIQPGGP